MVEATNNTLLSAVLDLTKQVENLNVRSATTASAVSGLRTETQQRHQENQREIKKIHAGVSASNAGVKRVEGELKMAVADIAEMKPVVARQKAREKFWAAVCGRLRRWWAWISAAVAAVAGLGVWITDNWPKLSTFFKKFGG